MREMTHNQTLTVVAGSLEAMIPWSFVGSTSGIMASMKILADSKSLHRAQSQSSMVALIFTCTFLGLGSGMYLDRLNQLNQEVLDTEDPYAPVKP